MKVAVFGQPNQEHVLDYVVQLLDELHKADAGISIEKDFYSFLSGIGNLGRYQTFTSDEGLDSSFDMFVSFGGDGTILRAITFVKDLGIPVVGVNTGRLGFLSTFRKEDVRKVVLEFLSGSYGTAIGFWDPRVWQP